MVYLNFMYQDDSDRSISYEYILYRCIIPYILYPYVFLDDFNKSIECRMKFEYLHSIEFFSIECVET